jgi:hypothetical protein
VVGRDGQSANDGVVALVARARLQVVSKKLGPLVRTMQLMMYDVARFLVVFFALFIGFAAAFAIWFPLANDCDGVGGDGLEVTLEIDHSASATATETSAGGGGGGGVAHGSYGSFSIVNTTAAAAVAAATKYSGIAQPGCDAPFTSIRWSLYTLFSATLGDFNFEVY